MSVAGLLFFNGLVHLATSIKVKGYAPGMITGGVLYLPISIFAYVNFWSSGQVNLAGVISSGLLGILYQGLPVGYLALAKIIRAR